MKKRSEIQFCFGQFLTYVNFNILYMFNLVVSFFFFFLNLNINFKNNMYGHTHIYIGEGSRKITHVYEILWAPSVQLVLPEYATTDSELCIR